jgi:hypothetical protein
VSFIVSFVTAVTAAGTFELLSVLVAVTTTSSSSSVLLSPSEPAALFSSAKAGIVNNKNATSIIKYFIILPSEKSFPIAVKADFRRKPAIGGLDS